MVMRTKQTAALRVYYYICVKPRQGLALSSQASANISLDATTKSRPGPLRTAGSDDGAASSGCSKSGGRVGRGGKGSDR